VLRTPLRNTPPIESLRARRLGIHLLLCDSSPLSDCPVWPTSRWQAVSPATSADADVDYRVADTLGRAREVAHQVLRGNLPPPFSACCSRAGC
jgi:hypothetical protein